MKALYIFNSKIAWMVYAGIAIFFLFKSCKENNRIRKEHEAQVNSVNMNMRDKAEEMSLVLAKSQARDLANDERMKRLLDSLRVKPKEIISYKYIKTERTINDTLYELELVECEDFQKVFVFNEKCFSASVDLTGENPTIKANITNEIHDINHYERRRLFGLKFTPRIGKKEFFQTLVSSCGDTIKNNQKLTYQ